MQQRNAQETRKKKRMHKRTLSRLIVRRRAGNSRQGWLAAGPFALPVALGRGGIKANKREGDGCNAARRVPAQAAVVARRAPCAPADAAAVAAHQTRRRLVRGSGRPPLQSAGQARARQQCRPPGARRRPLRFHHRARPQHAAAREGARQRGVHPCGARRLCAHRRLHRARPRDVAPLAGARRPAHQDRDRIASGRRIA